MRAYTQSAADALLHGDITQEVANYDPEAANFLPKRSAKHRVPKIFCTKNPVEKDLRGKKPRKTRARSPVVEIDTEESKIEENRPEQIVIVDDDDTNGNQCDDEADDVSPEPIVFSVPNPVTTRRMNPKRKFCVARTGNMTAWWMWMMMMSWPSMIIDKCPETRKE